MSRPYIPGGIGAVVATPLTSSAALDEDEYRRFCRWLVDNGVAFLQPSAATGQAYMTSEADYRRILELSMAEVGDRAFMTAYSGRPSTAETIRLTKIAEDVGCHTAFIIQPPFCLPDQEGMFLHFKAVADAVQMPLVFYNNPSRAGVVLNVDTMLRVLDVTDRYVALKQAHDPDLLEAALKLTSRIVVMPQAELELMWGLALGMPGALTFSANIIPKQMAEIITAWQAGDIARSRAIFMHYLPLMMAVLMEPVPGCVKYILNRMGWKMGEPHLPGHPPTAATARHLDALIEKYELADTCR